MEIQVTAFFALAAGFLSFVSPCVLPLVPSYMVFITGLSFDELEKEGSRARRIAAMHSLAFIGGFSLVFVLLGASATYLGSFFQQNQLLLLRLGGVVVLFFGLYLVGAFQWGALEGEKRLHLARKPEGMLGTGLVGMTFALGWTPCIGPILGSILVVAGASGQVSTGMFLLTLYALGLGIPFFLAGILFPQFVARVRFISKHLNVVTKISGVILIVVGLMMVTNTFSYLTSFLMSRLPMLNLEEFLVR
jgi:cytochrome c-type biogenesis protein